MSKASWLALWCVGLALAIGAAAARAAEPATADVDPLSELQGRFQAGLDEIVKKFSLPGMTAAYALPDGRVVAIASGMADKENGTKMSPDTRMPAGSVGKTFVAAMVVALAQDGKLSLDDKVEKWLGGEPWFGDLPNGKELTIRQLLMHRGGLTDHVNDMRFAVKVRQSIVAPGSDPNFYFKPDELVGFVLKKKPLFAPGEGYAYTDTGYILLGLIIERAGGAPYYDQMRKRFLEPLKLNRTEPANHRDFENIAAGYLAEKNQFGLPPKTVGDDGKLRFNPANEWTGGGLLSNPQDLVRWAKALYEGKALDKPYVDELLATDPADKDKPTKYGLGVFVKQSERGTGYGHGGWFPGYLTMVEYYPAQRVAVAAQCNSDARGDMVKSLMELVGEVLETVGKAR